MTLQNRVQPNGDILACDTRGLFMGNRGILHDDNKTLTHRRWRHQSWVTCALQFNGRNRTLMKPGNYTELFFHDEAVALAAGHRPCAECRRARFNTFRDASLFSGSLKEFDTKLHSERAISRVFQQKRHTAPIETLPSGAFFLGPNAQPHLVLEDAILPFKPEGYQCPIKRPTGLEAIVLTPQSSLIALREGYQPELKI